jgi:hypothetical protein
VRDYYYQDEKVVCLKEILNTVGGEGEYSQIVNEFYIDNDKLVGWISDTHDMATDDLYKTLQNKFDLWQKEDVLSYYDFGKGSAAQPGFFDTDKRSMQSKFIEAIKLKYPHLDSIKSGPAESDRNFVAEVFYHREGKREAAIYLLEQSYFESTPVEGSPKYIGQHAWSVRSLKTPGDFYYYLMTMQRENNIEALRKCIRKEGYRKSISDGGHEDTNFTSNKTIRRDSVTFDDLGITIDLYRVNFAFTLSIDTAFNDYGHAGVNYVGGGFQERMWLKKEGDHIYLENYTFTGH